MASHIRQVGPALYNANCHEDFSSKLFGTEGDTLLQTRHSSDLVWSMIFQAIASRRGNQQLEEKEPKPS